MVDQKRFEAYKRIRQKYDFMNADMAVRTLRQHEKFAALGLDFTYNSRTGDHAATLTYPYGITVKIEVKSDDFYSLDEMTDSTYEGEPTYERVAWHGRKQLRRISVLSPAGVAWCTDNKEYPPKRLPYRDDTDAWFTSGCNPYERFEYQHKAGASRSDAWVKAWAAVRREADMYTHMEAFGVVVTIFDREGEEITSDGVWGIDVDSHGSYEETWDTINEVVYDKLLDMERDIENAVTTAGERIAQYI